MKNLLVLIFMLVSLGVYSQKLTTGSKKARKLFLEAQEAYGLRDDQKAMGLVEEAIAEDSCFYEGHLLAADIYLEIDSTLKQVNALENAVEIDNSRFPKIYYVLGNAYLKLGEYKLAQKAYEQFVSNNQNTSSFFKKAKEKIIHCQFATQQIDNQVSFDAENLGDAINTTSDEYWPSLTIDGKSLIFTRLSPPVIADVRFRQLQEDFFWSDYVDGEWKPAKALEDINTPYNEGAQSISADGKLIFFTACTRKDGYGSCDIYFTQKLGNAWTKPMNGGASLNTASWESQPSVSANGEFLYFVSNRSGGKGGMDIWRCKLKGISSNGILQWSRAENLGDSINTSGSEMSPYIHSDGKTLYFASNKWPGMGGLDIFYSQLSKDSIWNKARNLGYPINTHKDEQGLIVDAAGHQAYYSSNRPGSEGLDIYRFELYPEARPEPVSYIKGKVIDSKSGLPVCSTVELKTVENGKTEARTHSCDSSGEFMLCLPLGTEYAFHVASEGYLFFSENFSLKEIYEVDDPRILEIKMERIEVGSKTVLRNIFFKTNSYELLDESIAELSLLKNFLAINLSVKIEIGGHTDNVGTESYNLELSENRAIAVYEYLLKEGVSETRLSFKGYGLSQPIDRNDTALGRAQNRRTEFRVIAVK